MTFQISHPQRAGEIVVVFVVDVGNVLSCSAPAHVQFAVLGVESLPWHHPLLVIHVFVFFEPVTEVFQNHISRWIDRPDLVGEPFDVANPFGIVGTPGTHIGSGVFLRKSFRQIETEAVHFVLRHPEFQTALHKILRGGTGEIEIISKTIWMRSRLVEPWISCRRAVVGSVPVQLCQRTGSPGVVKHDILHHRNSAFVALIDKGFQVHIRTIIFIRSEKEIRVVAPAVVSIKLVEWHQFNGVDAQFFEISEGIFQCFPAMLFYKIPQVQFVHQ